MTLISEAVVTLKKLSDDELFRLRYQAREDQLRQQWDMEYYYNTKFAEMEEQNAAITAEKDAMAEQHANDLRLIEELKKDLETLRKA